MTSLRRLASLLLLTILVAGCDLLFPPSALETALARCDLDAEPLAAWNDASLRLIDASEHGALVRASDRWFVSVHDDSIDASSGGGDASRGSVAASVRRAYGLELARELAPGLTLVRIPGDAAATARRLLRDDRVRYVHPDVALRPTALGDDPLLDQQWNLSGFGVPEAWNREAGNASIVVAVLDTGFDLDHPDLADRYLDGWDFYASDADPSTTTSTPDHGTHVTGIVAALGGNGVGVSGVVPSGVRILPIKVFDEDGGDTSGDDASSQDAVVQALHWIAGEAVTGPEPLDVAVRVANLSFGTFGAYEIVPALEDAIRVARRAGVLAFAATGNDASTPSAGVIAPANGPCAIAIGSVDEDAQRSAFSQYDGERAAVDLVGPGGESDEGIGILSTVPDDTYAYLSGTSMSTPFVSGVAALLASQKPDLTADDLLRALLEGAWLPPGASRLQLGFGIPCPDALLGATTTCGPASEPN